MLVVSCTAVTDGLYFVFLLYFCLLSCYVVLLLCVFSIIQLLELQICYNKDELS